MYDGKTLIYSIIITAILVAVLTSLSVNLAYIAIIAASIASGIIVAFTYSGEYLRARDIIPITSVIGYGIGYVIGIGISAIVYVFKGRINDLALLGVNSGYIALLVVTLFIAYFIGPIVYSRIWRTRYYKRRRR